MLVGVVGEATRDDAVTADELKAQNRSLWIVEPSPPRSVQTSTTHGPTQPAAAASDDRFAAMLQSIDDVAKGLEELRRTQAGGLPADYLAQLVNAIHTAQETGQSLKADVIMPPREQLELRLTPIHLLDQYNEYSSDSAKAQLLLGACLGGVIGLIASFALADDVQWSAPLVILVIVLVTAVGALWKYHSELEHRRRRQWRKITDTPKE